MTPVRAYSMGEAGCRERMMQFGRDNATKLAIGKVSEDVSDSRNGRWGDSDIDWWARAYRVGFIRAAVPGWPDGHGMGLP